MDDSVLGSIKTLLGIELDSTPFDSEIIFHINSAFMELYQVMDIGEVKTINSSEETWNGLFDGLQFKCPAIIDFVYLKVKLIFDPPSSSFVTESLKQRLQETEWRLSIQLEALNLEGGEAHE